MTNDDEVKADFYQSLHTTISADKIILLGDFNARVGRDYSIWPGVIGKHGVGNENSNGTLLLSLCTEFELCITNTLFEGKNQYKTTWQHMRSGHWHLIDYVIIRQRDRADVCDTKALPGTRGNFAQCVCLHFRSQPIRMQESQNCQQSKRENIAVFSRFAASQF